MNADKAWPTEIRLAKDRRRLTVAFDDGAAFEMPSEFLRVLSPSAEVRGHTPDQRQTVSGKINVAITAVEPVGNYAVRLVFDDGHSSGIYMWDYLHQIGGAQEDYWNAYLAELEEKGLSRQP